MATAAALDEAYLDTNIPFNAILGDREFGGACAGVLTDIEDETLHVCASVLVVLELANAIRKIGRAREMERRTEALTSLPIRFCVLSEPIVFEGVRLAQGAGVSPYDGTHVATMLALGVDTIISTDRDFDRFEEVKRIDPRNYMAERSVP